MAEPRKVYGKQVKRSLLLPADEMAELEALARARKEPMAGFLRRLVRLGRDRLAAIESAIRTVA